MLRSSLSSSQLNNWASIQIIFAELIVNILVFGVSERARSREQLDSSATIQLQRNEEDTRRQLNIVITI